MTDRKTDPQPFPVRGTATGYRDRWDADDSGLIQAQLAERERLIVAVRESAATVRLGKDRAARKPRQPATPVDQIATDPENGP